MTSPLFEVLDWVETDLGLLYLRRRALLGSPGKFVTEVTLDNQPLMSSLNTVSEEALAHSALEWCRADAPRVLVGGLGLGYTAMAALEHEHVDAVRVLEHLPQVIAWLRDGKVPLSDHLLADSRMEAQQGDVYQVLLDEPTERWDAILIDVDHSPSEPLGPASKSFHTARGLRSAARHLHPGGVLAVWSAEPDDRFARCMEEQFAESKVEVVPWENLLLDDEQPVEDVLFLGRTPPDGSEEAP